VARSASFVTQRHHRSGRQGMRKGFAGQSNEARSRGDWLSSMGLRTVRLQTKVLITGLGRPVNSFWNRRAGSCALFFHANHLTPTFGLRLDGTHMSAGRFPERSRGAAIRFTYQVWLSDASTLISSSHTFAAGSPRAPHFHLQDVPGPVTLRPQYIPTLRRFLWLYQYL